MDLQKVSKKLGVCSSLLAYVGAFSLFVMMCLTSVDVVGRYIFNRPITGVFELTQYLVLILIFSFIGYTQAQKGHVAVDLLLIRIKGRIRILIEIFNHVVCLLLMLLITWMGIGKAREMIDVGGASPNLQIPAYPFVFFLVLGCLVMCLELLRDVIELIADPKGGNRS